MAIGKSDFKDNPKSALDLDLCFVKIMSFITKSFPINFSCSGQKLYMLIMRFYTNLHISVTYDD